MTAQEQKKILIQTIHTKLKSSHIPQEIQPAVHQFLEECSIHHLQNVLCNLVDLKKFIQQAMQKYQHHES